MTNQGFDLNEISNRASSQVSLTVNSADPLERESSIRIKEAEAKHVRTKELIWHGIGAITMLAVVCLCVWNIGKRGLSTDEGKLYLGLLTTIVSALLGYVTGKSSK